eukprot:TRINITY_DN6994_c0_g1_i2.p1 TRINITY_DN6994_c0_g1~~TRINITY_DN6994_c0_g1_i2.p1  ORF type:complete len:684 (+),score=152.98 TRINITY_DN6994_c0_g1_i2:49-2100(+)
MLLDKYKLLSLLILHVLLICEVLSEADDGPSDPEFKENDGDLESDVNPLKAPEGNYHIVEEEGVVVLNRDTFAHFVKPKELVMVEFYAPWCGHCKTLEPEYEKAAKQLKKDGLILAKVDATKESELAKEYMVQGFPTMLLFRKGEKVEDYEGGRTSDEIIEYMKRQADPNWKPPPSVVLTLTQDNFTKVAKAESLMLTMFYAPWCKHCKQIMPEFEGAATELKGWGITLAKVDGTKEKDLADMNKIKGWPTLMLSRKGRTYDYDGPREKPGIIAYMKRQNELPSELKTTYSGVLNNMNRLESTVVGFFAEKTDLYEEYIAAANQMRGKYRFLHTFDTEIAGKFKADPNSIVVFQPEIFQSEYEESSYTFKKKSGTYKEIMEFIRKSSIPLVGQRTRTNMMHKYNTKPLIVVYYDVNYDHQYVKDTQYIREKVLAVAKHFRNSTLSFCISNEEEFTDELKALGLEDSGAEVNVAAYSEKQKFRLEPEDDFDAEILGNFVEGLRTGKVKPYMKSLPVPKKQDGPVLKIVANNYDDEVHKVKKDAVMFFYAPWCGHCKEFDPVYKKVAKKLLKENENIVFGRMDATSNDVPYMFPQLKGYPSIFFISAYEKFDPIVFNGDRTYKGFKDWVHRHTSIFLSDDEDEESNDLDDELPELPDQIESYQTENLGEAMQNSEADKTNPKDEL